MTTTTLPRTSEPTASAPSATQLPQSLVVLFAAGAGLSVATLYYNQPMLGVLAADLRASERAVGLVPTATQLGYAAGLLLLAPLGDRFDRRRLLLVKTAALALALTLAASAGNLVTLVVASALIGLAATLAQDIVPAAATLAPEAHRGRVVGNVMTGLLLGILLSRVVSGVVAEHLGWRFVFGGAALTVVGLGVALGARVPSFAPTTSLAYGALLRSLVELAARYRPLRQAALAQGLLSVAFSAFWSTLAVFLHGEPFHLGSSAAGAFGLAGAAGALAAPIAGRLADRRGPQVLTRLGAAIVALSFAAMTSLGSLPPGTQLALLVVLAIVFDFGVQATLVAHQTIVYALEPAARSRLNAVFLVSMFVGMATGSALGSAAFDAFGWIGVAVVATAASMGALVVRLRAR